MDFIRFLKNQTSATTYFTKSEIVEETKIAKRSLDLVIKRLVNSGVILYAFKSGKGGGVKIILVSKLIKELGIAILESKKTENRIGGQKKFIMY